MSASLCLFPSFYLQNDELFFGFVLGLTPSQNLIKFFSLARREFHCVCDWFLRHFEVRARSNNSETACVLLSWSSNCLADDRIKTLGNIAFVKIYSVVHWIVALEDAKLAFCAWKRGGTQSGRGFKRLCKMSDGHSNSGYPTELLKGTKNWKQALGA